MNHFYQKTSKLVESIYDTQLNPGKWAQVQKDLCAATGGVGSHILLFDENRSPLETLIHSSADQSAAVMMEEDYFHWYHQFDDYRIAKAIENGRQIAVTNDEITPDDKKETCPLYNEYFRYYDVQEQLIFGTSISQGKSLAVVHARPQDMGLHTKEERSLFVWLCQHVMRSVELNLKFNSAFEGKFDLFDIVSRDDKEILVLDKDCNIHWMNAGANKKLFCSSQLRIVRNKLVFQDSRVSNKVQKLVSEACVLSSKSKERCGFFKAEIDLTTYAISVFSTSLDISLFSSSTPVAVLVFQDPLSISLPSPQVIRSYLGLTKAECDLSLGLAKGYSLNDYAELNELSIHTVRSSLKKIMSKANVHKQTELIQLMRGLV